jgi:hypothetical protein
MMMMLLIGCCFLKKNSGLFMNIDEGDVEDHEEVERRR